ncbi:hypothetical protein MTP99_017785 [Tenebrio molitor]|nr:hypothetical protein MTP99_017785 [Tenebrio molitor]
MSPPFYIRIASVLSLPSIVTPRLVALQRSGVRQRNSLKVVVESRSATIPSASVASQQPDRFKMLRVESNTKLEGFTEFEEGILFDDTDSDFAEDITSISPVPIMWTGRSVG